MRSSPKTFTVTILARFRRKLRNNCIRAYIVQHNIWSVPTLAARCLRLLRVCWERGRLPISWGRGRATLLRRLSFRGVAQRAAVSFSFMTICGLHSHAHLDIYFLFLNGVPASSGSDRCTKTSTRNWMIVSLSITKMQHIFKLLALAAFNTVNDT